MKSKIIITSTICLSLIFVISAYFFNKQYHIKVRSSPKMYVYQTFWGPPNSALIIEDLKYKAKLISYYDTIEKDPSSNPVVEVPLKTLPQFEVVYVMGYTEDGQLADVVSYYERGPLFGGNYLRGWVYIKTLHSKPANKTR